MLSIFLFVVLVCGRANLVASTLLTPVPATTTDLQISFKLTDSGGLPTDTYAIKRYDASGNSEGVVAIGSKIGETITDKGPTGGDSNGVLTADTTYKYKVTKTGGSEDNGHDMATLDVIPTVTVEKVDSTSVTFKWTDFADYTATSLLVNGVIDSETTLAVNTVKTGLTPSSAVSIAFKGTDDSTNPVAQAKTYKVCTAPLKPTLTYNLESDGATTPTYTLTLTLAYAEKIKVSKISVGTVVSGYTQPTACETCTGCAVCTVEGIAPDLIVRPDDASVEAPKYVLKLVGWKEADSISDIKITSEFDDSCERPGSVEGTSLASLANKEAMLVYLAIGAMASIMRVLGLEIGTPLGTN